VYLYPTENLGDSLSKRRDAQKTSNNGAPLASAKKALGARIRLLREQHGLSKTELARAANIHRIYLGDIEQGRANMTVSVLVRIAHNLQTSLADLFRNLYL
jgi:DNA-binding XRE family transcriptional regulator